MGARDLAVIALVIGAPWALVVIVAFIRGYAISLHMERPRDKPPRDP